MVYYLLYISTMSIVHTFIQYMQSTYMLSICILYTVNVYIAICITSVKESGRAAQRPFISGLWTHPSPPLPSLHTRPPFLLPSAALTANPSPEFLVSELIFIVFRRLIQSLGATYPTSYSIPSLLCAVLTQLSNLTRKCMVHFAPHSTFFGLCSTVTSLGSKFGCWRICNFYNRLV